MGEGGTLNTNKQKCLTNNLPFYLFLFYFKKYCDNLVLDMAPHQATLANLIGQDQDLETKILCQRIIQVNIYKILLIFTFLKWCYWYLAIF